MGTSEIDAQCEKTLFVVSRELGKLQSLYVYFDPRSAVSCALKNMAGATEFDYLNNPLARRVSSQLSKLIDHLGSSSDVPARCQRGRNRSSSSEDDAPSA